MNKLIMSARLLTGLYTPFLQSFWGEEELGIAKDWLQGKNYPDALKSLKQKILSDLDNQWKVWPVNLGRSAIQIALQAMHFPQESEVLLPSFACTGLVMPVIQAGLRPVFVDVDEQFNVRFESVLQADSPYVRAIILSHLSGCWAKDTDAIIDWAKSRGVFVVEDAAQAQGLMRNGKAAGTFGDVGIFSTNGGKIIFGSGGGWLITRNSDIIDSIDNLKFLPEQREHIEERIKNFLNHYVKSTGDQCRIDFKNILYGKFKKMFQMVPQPNSVDAYRFSLFSMSDIEAQLLVSQMNKIPTIIKERRNNASRWRQNLTGLNFRGIHLLPNIDNVHTKMLVSFAGETATKAAYRIRTTLFNYGVETETSYTPLHLRAAFKSIRRTSMPNTEQQWQSVFSLPVRPNLDPIDWERIDRALLFLKYNADY